MGNGMMVDGMGGWTLLNTSRLVSAHPCHRPINGIGCSMGVEKWIHQNRGLGLGDLKEAGRSR